MSIISNRWVLLHHQVGKQLGGRGDHFDFMLSAVDVSLDDAGSEGARFEDVRCLWTWALPTNPLAQTLPLECLVERLPDHRAAYLEYEGPVSGDRGHVDRVACGSYEVIGWSEELIELRLQCNDTKAIRYGGPFLVSLTRQSEGWSLSWLVLS